MDAVFVIEDFVQNLSPFPSFLKVVFQVKSSVTILKLFKFLNVIEKEIQRCLYGKGAAILVVKI